MSESPLLPPTPPPGLVYARPIQLPYATQPVPAQNPLCLSGISRRTAAFDVLLILLTFAAALLGPGIVLGTWMALSGQQPYEPAVNELTISKWIEAAIATGLLAFLLRYRRLPPAALGLELHRPGKQLLWGAAGLGLTYCWMFIAIMVISVVYMLYPGIGEDLVKRVEMLALLPRTVGQIILLMIPVAIGEEVFFRGLLLPYLRRLTGAWWPAVLISSTIFASLHFEQGLIGILQVGGVAVVFALVFIRSRSLLATIVAHFGFDVAQMMLLLLMEESGALAA